MARPITIKELREQAMLPACCPVCGRPNYKPSDHHLVPRSRGGKVTKTLCQDCHTAIHATFTNKELEEGFASIDALLAHGPFAKTIAFIAKQDGRVKTRATRARRQA